MVVLCDGMVRSGSTWAFNVVLRLLQLSASDWKIFHAYAAEPGPLLPALDPTYSHALIKTHVLDDLARNMCRSGEIRSVYTWRDPYDAIASCIKFGVTFENSVGAVQNALDVWSFHESTKSACIIPYPSIVREPERAIRQIIVYLDLTIGQEQLERVAHETSLESMRQACKNVGNLDSARVVRDGHYTFDRETLLHQNHIQDGTIGYGAGVLAEEQRETVASMLEAARFWSLCASREEAGA